MIFDNTKILTIPEGAVNSIAINGNTIWTRPHIYGVSWNKTGSILTRTGDTINFEEPTAGTGTSQGSSPFNNLYPWNQITKVVDGNNTLVKIPKFWFKWTNTSNALTLQICDKPINGFYVSPLHADRSDGKGERDVAYVGRYRCAATTYYSKTGLAPATSMTIDTARTKIAALGTGYYQSDFAAFWTIRMLYLVEFANWDAYEVIPRPNAPTYANIKSGYTDSMTYHTGTSANGYSFQYRWIEDPWAGMLEWCDGIRFANNNVYCIMNPSQFSNTANGTNVCDLGAANTVLEGYIKDWKVSTIPGFEWVLWPDGIVTTEQANSMPDWYFKTASGNAMYVGGSRTINYRHGPFFMYCDFTNTQTSEFIAARLMKLP